MKHQKPVVYVVVEQPTYLVESLPGVARAVVVCVIIGLENVNVTGGPDYKEIEGPLGRKKFKQLEMTLYTMCYNDNKLDNKLGNEE